MGIFSIDETYDDSEYKSNGRSEKNTNQLIEQTESNKRFIFYNDSENCCDDWTLWMETGMKG